MGLPNLVIVIVVDLQLVRILAIMVEGYIRDGYVNGMVVVV